eukprot:12739109-Ditylum_brightwellii.AAC.1
MLASVEKKFDFCAFNLATAAGCVKSIVPAVSWTSPPCPHLPDPPTNIYLILFQICIPDIFTGYYYYIQDSLSSVT